MKMTEYLLKSNRIKKRMHAVKKNITEEEAGPLVYAVKRIY